MEKTPKSLVEALLFASPRPLELEVLAKVSGLDPAEGTEILRALAAEYEEAGRGFALAEVAGGWQLRSRPDFAPEIAALRQARPRNRFSRSAMETLSIIAYRQPLTRPEIEHVRGVDCGATLKSLLAHGMIRIIGRKEAPGRPVLYGTTDQFLQYFSLRDLESLPTLEEVQELDEGMEPQGAEVAEPAEGRVSGLVEGGGEPAVDREGDGEEVTDERGQG